MGIELSRDEAAIEATLHEEGSSSAPSTAMRGGCAITFDHFVDGEKQFLRITGDVMCNLLRDCSPFASMKVIDCRSVREYEAGHIKHAIHYDIRNNLDVSEFFEKIIAPKTLYIFHCEVSLVRGPMTCRKFRICNAKAGYAEDAIAAFVLDGGFSSFYPSHREWTVGRYVTEASGYQGYGPN
jgi:rhodanese-related sulfurtransferase